MLLKAWINFLSPAGANGRERAGEGGAPGRDRETAGDDRGQGKECNTTAEAAERGE